MDLGTNLGRFCRRTILAVFAVYAGTAQAELYKCIHENGTVSYTQKTLEGASCKSLLTDQGKPSEPSPSAHRARQAKSNSAQVRAAAEKQGGADGREFARDNQRIGMAVTHNVCLAGSKVAADNLPPNVPTSARNEYGTAVYNGCMASAR